MKKPRGFVAQLRYLVVNSDLTVYRIAKDCEIERASLSRFIHGKGWLSMEKMDALGKYLGWTVTAKGN